MLFSCRLAPFLSFSAVDVLFFFGFELIDVFFAVAPVVDLVEVVYSCLSLSRGGLQTSFSASLCIEYY